MSLAKLFVSGFLVAGGLILGAFTLLGYLDPQWMQKRAQAAKAQASGALPDAPSINAFQSRTQFVAPAPQEAFAQPQTVKASAKPDVKPAEATDPNAAAAKAAAARKRREDAKKRLEEKKLAEKAERERIEKAKQQPQQTAWQSFLNWLGN